MYRYSHHERQKDYRLIFQIKKKYLILQENQINNSFKQNITL